VRRAVVTTVRAARIANNFSLFFRLSSECDGGLHSNLLRPHPELVAEAFNR